MIDKKDSDENILTNLSTNEHTRLWDLSRLSDDINDNGSSFTGYEQHLYNGYVPKNDVDSKTPKTFEEIAKIKPENQPHQGIEGLGFLKGDVNDLSVWLQYGWPEDKNSDNFMSNINFARMCSFSRQLNLFFSGYLPHLCETEFPNVYTVFAGGDDFCLIGQWQDIQNLALRLRHDFKEFCGNNQEFTFAAGIVIEKSDYPIQRFAELAEHALQASKSAPHGKDGITIFNRSVKWIDFEDLQEIANEIAEKLHDKIYSTGLVYPFIEFAHQKGLVENTEILITDPKKLQATLYRARSTYHLARFAERNKHKPHCSFDELTSLFQGNLKEYNEDFIIALFNALYSIRS